MTQALATNPTSSDLADLVTTGNIDKLNDADKARYLMGLCKEMGISPLSRPFDILKLNGKTVVYANKGAAAQLRVARGISVDVVYSGPLRLGGDQINQDIYTVEVKATDKEGRTSWNIGAVAIKAMGGEPLANAIMRCYTKATRRVVLDHAGLGFPDESELPQAEPEKQKIG